MDSSPSLSENQSMASRMASSTMSSCNSTLRTGAPSDRTIQSRRDSRSVTSETAIRDQTAGLLLGLLALLALLLLAGHIHLHHRPLLVVGGGRRDARLRLLPALLP